MIALRYFCGFSLQIFPYAFFCIYPFRDCFRISFKKTMLIGFFIFLITVIPFSLTGQFNIGGDYIEFVWNVIFYTAVLLFGVLYCFTIRMKISEKLFVFFIVMSYGFFVTSSVTFLFRTFKFRPDNFMYPPAAVVLTLVINLLLAWPFLMLVERIRMMVDANLETRIWRILCLLPALFILIASVSQFSSVLTVNEDIIVHVLFVVFAIFAFIVYGVFFGVMGYIYNKKEEQLVSERMLESYQKQAENNEYIHKIHHEIRHHMNALSAYLKRGDYEGALQYIGKFSDDAQQIPFVTYTDNALVNSIFSEFYEHAVRCNIKIEYNIIISRKLGMEDIDLCRILANILENAIEGCEKVSEERRFIRLTLLSKGNFLFIKCENTCDENSLSTANGKYRTTKGDIGKHGYGLKIIREIAEKYNGILSVETQNGIFAVTTNLCLDENTENE